MALHTIAFMSQKGGSGKTTLSIATAVSATHSREKVLLIDTDPQGSATLWAQTRESESPVVTSARATRLQEVIDAGREAGMSLAIVDTAPGIATPSYAVASVADLIVIPTRPSAFDLATCEAMVTVAKESKRPACIVLNASPYRAPEIPEAIEQLQGLDVPVAPFAIMDRRSFMRSVARGQAAGEYEPEGKAAQESRMLWAWIKRQLWG